MKRVIAFVLFMASIVSAQTIPPIGTVPFIAGNDTLFRTDTVLTSSVLDMSWTTGAVSAGFQFTVVGDSAAPVYIYYKSRLSGMSWGVPHDSLGVDSVQIAKIDTASSLVGGGDAFYFPLADESWWGYHDEAQIIIQTTSAADTIYVICRVKGLRNE